MTLTRRDRAAMVLALECLRQSPFRTGQYDWLPRARLVLEHGGNSADDLALALDPPVKCSLRLLRARLALYLRAVLRADAGDFGPWRCAGCGNVIEARNLDAPLTV